MHRLPLLFLSLVGIGVIVIFGVVVIGESRDVSQSAKTPTPTVLSTDPAVGAINPRVSVVEFGDFECQACADVAPILKQVIKIHPDVQLVWKDFPVTSEHPNATKAAAAARCAAEQGKFWLMSDELFTNAGSFSVEGAVASATTIGLDVVAFSSCIATGRNTALVDVSFREGLRVGVNATPTFFIGGTKFEDLQTLSDFEAALRLVTASK